MLSPVPSTLGSHPFSVRRRTVLPLWELQQPRYAVHGTKQLATHGCELEVPCSLGLAPQRHCGEMGIRTRSNV